MFHNEDDVSIMVLLLLTTMDKEVNWSLHPVSWSGSFRFRLGENNKANINYGKNSEIRNRSISINNDLLKKNFYNIYIYINIGKDVFPKSSE